MKKSFLKSIIITFLAVNGSLQAQISCTSNSDCLTQQNANVCCGGMCQPSNWLCCGDAQKGQGCSSDGHECCTNNTCAPTGLCPTDLK